MIRIFNYLLLATGIFIYSQTVYAQTLNEDTLVKYRVSKILTYELDSTGHKTLIKTRCINENGQVYEFYSYNKHFFDSIHYSIQIDTARYKYDSNGRVLHESKTRKTIDYIPTKNEPSEQSWDIEFSYKKFFVINPWSKKIIRHIHITSNKKIIKSYKNGSCTGYAKYFSRNGVECIIEHYTLFTTSTAPENSYTKKSNRRSNYHRKYKSVRTCSRNLQGDIIEENTNITFYNKKRLKKPLKYSNTSTYEIIYKGSFVYSCKSINNSMNTEDIKIYEYITNPE